MLTAPSHIRKAAAVWAAGLTIAALAPAGLARAADAATPAAAGEKRVAAIVTAYFHNSHADSLVSRLVQTDTLDFKGRQRALKLASLYVDQVPQNDMSRKIAADYKIPIYPNIADALTLGTGKLAVDGVLLIAEHGVYPASATGQIQYPKRRFFEEIVKVFEASQRVVPVYIDKHLADNWEDAKWIYDTAVRLKIPLMAGSSLRPTWRRPAIDVRADARLDEILCLNYGPLETYGFHALEALDTLAARRAGGQTGIRSVQCLSGPAVWEAAKNGVFSLELAQATIPHLPRPVLVDKPIEQIVKEPVLFVIEYDNGPRACVLHVGELYADWAAAWRYKDDPRVYSTLFWTQDARPMAHFGILLDGIESMIESGKPAWPVEGTLLTTGALNALMISRKEGGRKIDTPQLRIKYTPTWVWKEPPPPPPDRPFGEQ